MPLSFRYCFSSNPAVHLDQSVSSGGGGGPLLVGGLVQEFTWLRKLLKPGFQAQLALSLSLAVGPGG